MSRRLLKYGGEALKPHFVDGRWERPLISKRVVSKRFISLCFLPPFLPASLPPLISPSSPSFLLCMQRVPDLFIFLNHFTILFVCQAARLRKEAVMNGRVGPWQPSVQDSNGEKREGTKQVLGWDPAWDTVKAPKILRPAKLHARERNREER